MKTKDGDSPVSDPQGLSRGVNGDNCQPGFTVSLSFPLVTDIKFNYWIIQTKP